jgi:hypothetical protein
MLSRPFGTAIVKLNAQTLEPFSFRSIYARDEAGAFYPTANFSRGVCESDFDGYETIGRAVSMAAVRVIYFGYVGASDADEVTSSLFAALLFQPLLLLPLTQRLTL